MFSHPANNRTLTNVFPGSTTDSVELGRFVLLDRVPANMTVATLKQLGRHHDKTSARCVAAWLLSRQHWTSGRIADELDLESSTIRHGLARVETTDHLRAAACRAELLLLGLG